MNTSTDNILEKAKARLLFHKSEAERHSAVASKIEISIHALKSLIDELDSDFDEPLPQGEPSAEVAQLAPPETEPERKPARPTERTQEQRGGPTIGQRVKELFEISPHLKVAEVADKLDLRPQQVYTAQWNLGVKFGQVPAPSEADEDSSQDEQATSDPEVDEPEPRDEDIAAVDEAEAPEPARATYVPVPSTVPVPRHEPTGKHAAGTKFYLQDKATGKYLHEDLTAMIMNKGELHLVEKRDHAWCNTETKLLNVRRALPNTMDLIEVPVIS